MEKLIEHIGQEEDIIIVSNKYIKPILIQKFSNQMRKITFKSFDEVKDDIYTTIDYQMLFHNLHFLNCYIFVLYYPPLTESLFHYQKDR